jgi:hypothetical protein
LDCDESGPSKALSQLFVVIDGIEVFSSIVKFCLGRCTHPTLSFGFKVGDRDCSQPPHQSGFQIFSSAIDIQVVQLVTPEKYISSAFLNQFTKK